MALATTALSELLPLIRQHVPGCPNPLIVQELRMASIEFCERTKMWREEFAVTFDAQDHEITPFNYAVIHEFEVATFDDGSGTEFGLMPVPHMMSNAQDRDVSTTAQPIYITQPYPDTVTLIPYGEGTVTIQAIMKPISRPRYGVVDATTWQARINVLPTFILDRYGETLATGALGRLMAMLGKRWSEPNMAAARLAMFRSELDALSNSNIRGQQRAQIRSAASWV
jgi:hypothetical protein